MANWTDNVNTWLSANPNATDADKSAAARASGGTYDAKTGAFNYGGQSYDAKTNATTNLNVGQQLDARNAGKTLGLNDILHPYAFTGQELAEGKTWFDSGADYNATMQRAQSLGMTQNQVAALWQETHPTADRSTNPYNSTGMLSGAGGLTMDPGSKDSTTTTTGGGNNLNASTATATPWAVTADQTVAGQLQPLLADDNPLVQMARTQGLESANQRGLLNSSLGAEAGALAHYQYAMPIAQADAATAASAARSNADNSTQVSLANASAQNQFDLASFNAQKQLELLNQQNKNTLGQLTAQQQNTLQNTYLSQMSTFQNMLGQYTQQIQMADMPAEAKTEQIAQLQASMNNLISWAGAAYGNMPGWTKTFSLLPATLG